MANKTIKGAITGIGLKGSTTTITIKTESEDIRVDEIKAIIDKNTEFVIHDPQTDLDEFGEEAKSEEGKDNDT